MIRLAVLVFGALIAYGCTSENTSTKGQMISCSVANGVVSNCHPMTSADTAGAPGTCQDVDEDGDGEPHDMEGSDSGSGSDHATGSDDNDGDGVPNVDDCDNEPGGDDPAGGAHD